MIGWLSNLQFKFLSRSFNIIYNSENLFLFFLWTVQRPVDIKNRPKIPIPDEDPYSIAGNGGGSSGSSGFGASGSSGEVSRVAATRQQLLLQSQQLGLKRSEKPPKLPPRDNVYPRVMKVSCDFLHIKTH